MSFSPKPTFSFREITDIPQDFLKHLGVKFLMIDLDNTIAAYNESLACDAVASWAADIKEQGIDIFIVSNSMRKKRVEAFAKQLDVKTIMNAKKPSTKGVFQAMKEAGYSAKDSAFIGDQIFTDTLAANRAGVTSIIVNPRGFTNFIISARFAAETPFRAMCKNNNQIDKCAACADTPPSKAKTLGQE